MRRSRSNLTPTCDRRDLGWVPGITLVAKIGEPQWSEPDLADLTSALRALWTKMGDGGATCRVWVTERGEMSGLANRNGWHLGMADGVSQADGFCMAHGMAAAGDVLSTVLLPEEIARRILVGHRKGGALDAQDSPVRYSLYVGSHEFGHAIDYHHRFTGAQTPPMALTDGAIRVEAIVSAAASMIITELCADGYCAATLGKQTVLDRIAFQNRAFQVYWKNLERLFADPTGPDRNERRTVAVIELLIRAMRFHAHSIAFGIAQPALPLPVAKTLWTPPRRDLGKWRDALTTDFREVWAKRYGVRPVDFASRFASSGLQLAERLGFTFKSAPNDQCADWLLGPKGGFS